MIRLSESNYIGQGLHRKCYYHPDDANKCIKINYNHGAEQETNREVAYYKHLIKRKINWDSLPQYYGCVATNYGEGHVFELIRNYDGKTAISLETYLASQQLTQQHFSALVDAFMQLKSDLLKNHIITMTLKSKNILFQLTSPEHSRLIIIDNIGNATFIPVANYITYFANKKIERTWQRFLTSIIKENQHNPLIVDLVNAVLS